MDAVGKLWSLPAIGMDFVRLEPLANVSYITELLIWLLTLVVWVYTPGLLGVVLEAGRQDNPDSGAVYISRFVSYGLFRFLVYLLGSLSMGLTVLRLLSRSGFVPQGNYIGILSTLALLFGGMYLFLDVRSLSFKLWRYILLDKFSGGLLTQDYFFQDWIRALLMAVVSLLTFAPLTTEALWAIAGGAFLLVQLLGIVQVVRRLTQASTGFLFLFLYLCAHEVAPFLYIAGATIYLSRGDLLLLNTFQ